MSESKFVTIKRKAQSRIPSEVYSDSIQKIGCGFVESTKDIIRGLTNIQEKLILPKIIGVPYDHVNFIDKAREYYCDLDVIVPLEGIKLNITTQVKKVMDEGKEVEVEIPVLPVDYIQYKRCLLHGEVAKNKEQLDESTQYKFYIEDETLELKKKTDSVKVRRDAQLEYLKLSAEDKSEENLPKVNQILTVLKGLHKKSFRGLKTEEKVIILEEVMLKHPEEFTKVATDKSLGTKAIIEEGLEFKLIKVISGTYFDKDDEKQELGNTTEDFVKYLESQKGSSYLMQLKARLKEVKK